ncbi:MAG TPA: hypothetical protein EYQ00_11355 [Dehalococcoidia bacterium]|nr:hypothetical protein [Dehalococcoidia bacterium]
MTLKKLIKHAAPEKGVSRMKMSNPNETLMLIFGIGVVIAWVTIAATASYFSIVEERDISDSQLTVIGLLGGPALLVITTVLDLFKGKESAKISVLPEQLAIDHTSCEAVDAHTRLMEEIKVKHELDMEKLQKEHNLDMEAFKVTKAGDKK